MSHTEGKLTQIGNFAYELIHDGWRKGGEQFRNRFSFQVSADKEAGETPECITTRLVTCWNALCAFTTEQIKEGIDLAVLVKERDELVARLSVCDDLLREYAPTKYHSGYRTNPLGELFRGRCNQCGKEDLTIQQIINEECPNTLGIIQEEALLKAIEEE